MPPESSPKSRSALVRSEVLVRIGLGVLLILGAVGLGRFFGHEIPALEEWIAGQGPVGGVVFVGIVVVATSLFVPDTVFAVMAGVLFGIVEGTLLISLAALLTASFNFALSRWWLHGMVHRWLERQPRLMAIEKAVNREGLRFQFLLRLTPLSPVSVSYLLGVTQTRFPTFLLACFGLIPGLFVEVYLGQVAQHLAQAVGHPVRFDPWVFALKVLGLLVCLGVIVYVSRVARRAIIEAEAVENPAGLDASR